jgi:hypothetical protein
MRRCATTLATNDFVPTFPRTQYGPGTVAHVQAMRPRQPSVASGLFWAERLSLYVGNHGPKGSTGVKRLRNNASPRGNHGAMCVQGFGLIVTGVSFMRVAVCEATTPNPKYSSSHFDSGHHAGRPGNPATPTPHLVQPASPAPDVETAQNMSCTTSPPRDAPVARGLRKRTGRHAMPPKPTTRNRRGPGVPKDRQDLSIDVARYVRVYR